MTEDGSPRLALRLLTEDSGRFAMDTLRHIVLEMLRLLSPSLSPGDLEITPPTAEAQGAVRANMWKSTNPRHEPHIRSLVQMIAEDILRSRLVLFHMDGDTKWKHRAKCLIRKQFEDIIRLRVTRQLRAARPELDSKSALDRLVLLVPHYSIEAWLYQNTEVAVRICREKYRGRDVEKFETWAQDRTTLDEVEKPKEATCLTSEHNRDLASSGYPAAAAYAAKASFHAAVEALCACADLGSFLDRERAGKPAS